jgi:hypothetical protein
MLTTIIALCTQCRTPFPLVKKHQCYKFRAGKPVYCSEQCRWERHSEVASETMACTNRKYASQRMKTNNPMRQEAARHKMQATLQAMGHAPKIRGGNGTGPTPAQRLLAETLGWSMEYVVKTHAPKGNPDHIPTNYKLDIANPSLKLAIEVDGMSHTSMSRQAQDRKKEQMLTGFGWTVLRFTNQEVMEHLPDCVQIVQSTILKLKTIIPTSPMAS